jgi:signal transduction histidine kinase
MTHTVENRKTGLEHGVAGTSVRVAWWLALSLWVLSVCFAVAALAIMLLVWSTKVPTAEAVPVLYPALMATAFSTVGAVVASRRSENPVGWIMCAAGLLFASNALAGSYAAYALYSGSEPMPGAAFAAWANVWTVSIPLLPLLLLLFPDGRLPSRRWRPVVWLIIGSGLAEVVASTFAPGRFPGWPPARNPFGVAMLDPLLDLYVTYMQTPLLVLTVLLPAMSLLVRFRGSRAVERQQLKWFVSAGALVAFAATLLFVVGMRSSDLIESVLWGFLVLAVCAVPASMGVAILRYRLWDIDLVMNRALVYGMLTACVFGIYVLVVGGLGVLLQTRGNLLVSILAAGLVAALFQPLRERLQRGMNRLMYGERDDPYAVLSRLGQRLESTLASDDVLPAVTRTLQETLKLPYAEIQLKRNEGFETAASAGDPVGETLRLPLIYGGEQVGRLVLGLRAGEKSFSSEENRLFEDLAHQVGVAAHATLLSNETKSLFADLQRSRERLVSAREEERRRLRRDLHDGLGPQLASLTMTAEAARDLISTDPGRAEELLGSVMERAQDAVFDVRRLVYELRPPALDALGLLEALRAQADHHSDGGIRVTVEAPGMLPPLPAAVEVAAYRIVMEAMNNVARHAYASTCEVRLSLDDQPEVLILEVADDGRGIGEDHKSGVGLSSMRERAEELGGSCVVSSAPSGGTRVKAQLPCVKGAADETGLRKGV